MEIITTHINADFDCLGSMIAALRLYPHASAVFPGSQEKGLRDFSASHPEYLPKLKRAKDIDLEQVTRLIIVDCQVADRIGRFAELIDKPDVEVLIFDHHPQTAESIRNSGGVIRPCGALSSIMVTLLAEQGIALTPEEATLLMLGIYEDTGRLSFISTTRDDYQAAAWLLDQGARLNVVSDFINQELTAQQVGLLDTLLKSLKTSTINGIRISIAHAACETYIADIAGLAHILRDMEGLDALFLVVAMDNRVCIVARSRIREVNSGEIMRHFNGGGHATAASATVHNLPLKQVLKKLDEVLRIAITPGITAADIMSSPVKTMSVNLTIEEARDMLTRYNCNAMPVIDRKRMVGIISRKTVEKSLYHDLGKAPVSDFMSTEFMTASTSTPIADIQEYMVEGNRRFVPVFDCSRLIGAVTRTDLLRHMYGGRQGQAEALYDLESLSYTPKNRSIAGLIHKRLPTATISLLKELGNSADQLGLSIYAVGGFVRDLLLGIENLDLDLTVEGDGIFFAESYAALHGGRVRSHAAFNTAVIVRPDGMKIDVASTRLEFYDSPGMLPTVERSSLRHDLYRRDFTINTLAFCINKDRFGILTDFYGGQQDLRDQRIKVLHNLSFVEDPTRVFRAIRFEKRLGFKITPHTENLIQSAIRMKVLDKLGGKRLLTELVQLFSEQDPTAAITRMSGLGLFAFIHPNLKLGLETDRVVHASLDQLTWFRLLYLPDHCEQWQVYLLAVCDNLKEPEFREVCTRLDMPGRISAAVFNRRSQAIATLEGIQRRLKKGVAITNSNIHEWFDGLPLEMLLHLAAKAQKEQVRRYVSHYITTLRHIHCELNGNALKELGLKPGPLFSRICKQLLTARLDGEISSRQEEIELARKLIQAQQGHAIT